MSVNGAFPLLNGPFSEINGPFPSGVALANQTKERSVHELFSQGHSGTKVRYVNRACFKRPEFTKMGEIHEFFVLALSLVWFAGATPDSSNALMGRFPSDKSPGKHPFLRKEALRGS